MEFTHVCINGGGWLAGTKPAPGPETNELVTVIGTEKINDWPGFLLKEYPHGVYAQMHFRPIDKEFAEDLTAKIEQELKEVEPELIPV